MEDKDESESMEKNEVKKKKEVEVHNDDSEKEKESPPPENAKVSALTKLEQMKVSGSQKGSDKSKLPYEDIIQQLEERIGNLLKKTDFTGTESRPDLKFVQRQTRYTPDMVLNRRIVERIVKLGIAHVFLKAWQSVITVDYLSKERHPAFKNLQTILSIVWNCSDKSVTLCECLVKCGVIQLIMGELTSAKIDKTDYKDDNIVYLTKGYLGILHNIVRLCSDSRRVFRSANAVKILRNFLLADQALVKTKAYLILSYIISEDENEIINATDENIQFIIEILREALHSENHFSKRYAFWGGEIADGLNHLARNDHNKVRMGRLGALPLYIQLLSSESVDEQNLGTAGLWLLAFKDENKQLMRQQPGCMEGLQRIATGNAQETVRRAARGALWVVKSVPAERPPVVQIEAEANVPHVMVSYHWSAQSTMLRLCEKLKAAGYKVWMDVENMSGSTLEAMALAVEQAAVVLVAMAQGYKDSPSCRTESEYIYRCRKDIIPLLVQPGYVPDGWLGMLVGAKLYFDFSEERCLESQTPRLIKELGNRGRLPGNVRQERSSSCRAAPVARMSSSLSTSSLHSYNGVPGIKAVSGATQRWGFTEIRIWLEKHELAHKVDQFLNFNGELLAQLKKMYKSAPEHFYRTLEVSLGFDLISCLKFTKALDELA